MYIINKKNIINIYIILLFKNNIFIGYDDKFLELAEILKIILEINT